jgi:selenide,water dikinase
VHACTDVTGFSFLGHLHEMMDSKYSCQIDSGNIPYIREAFGYAKKFLITAAAQRNRNHVEKFVDFQHIPFGMQEILFDPQTSGGLLVAVSPSESRHVVNDLQAIGLPAALVGVVTDKHEKEISVY